MELPAIMKKYFLFFIGLSLLGLSFAQEELPKASFGKYGGEMPAYTVFVEGTELEIDRHDVFITLLEEEVVYVGGELKLSGTYTVFKQDKNEYVIKANLTNGKTLDYEIEFTWNKKDEKIYMSSRNGQSEAVLERIKD